MPDAASAALTSSAPQGFLGIAAAAPSGAAQFLLYGFVALLVAGTLVRIWLASRQMRHVAMHRGAVPAPFDTQVPLEAHQRAADYTIVKTRLSLPETAFGTAVVVCWTLLGGLDALNRALAAWLGGGMPQQLALLACFGAIGALLDLPFALYRTFGVEARFGFNKTSARLWLADACKSLVVAVAIGLPIAWLILWLMGTAGTGWWLWAWGAWVGFNLLLMVVYPTLIAPLFNRFEALSDETLRARVSGLMARCGFRAQGFYVMDGSRRSAHANAYFTGFGAAKRVVFYDTLLARLSPDEVDAVLAHELGHFRHRHIQKRMLAMFALSLGAFALLGWLSGQSWFYLGLGVRPNLAAPNDALALILFMLVLPVAGFFLSPLLARGSRRDEFQADAFAVAQTSRTDLASALRKLYEDNASTLTPDPAFVRFYYSHPPASERLARIATA
jgi:STE24 endopeptidase